MRPLILGQPEQETIKRVCDFAAAHKFSIYDMLAIVRGMQKPAGDWEGFLCVIPVGYRCVFSIEQHPSGWKRHLSVSVDGDKYPNERAVEMLAKEFGFRFALADRQWEIWLEEHTRAVNVVEPLA